MPENLDPSKIMPSDEANAFTPTLPTAAFEADIVTIPSQTDFVPEQKTGPNFIVRRFQQIREGYNNLTPKQKEVLTIGAMAVSRAILQRATA